MKTSQFFCIILVIALAIVSWRLVRGGSSSTETADSLAVTNEAYDCIMTRTSCRAFTDYRPTEAQIDSLVRAGLAAPTARNARPWDIIVITDRDILDTIASECKNIKMAAEAPLALVACGNLGIARSKGGDEYWEQDVSAITENILLAAHSMGLGAVWCGIYPIPERVKFVKELLELPDSIEPLNIIPIGQPKSPLQPKDKYDAERIHYNGY